MLLVLQWLEVPPEKTQETYKLPNIHDRKIKKHQHNHGINIK